MTYVSVSCCLLAWLQMTCKWNIRSRSFIRLSFFYCGYYHLSTSQLIFILSIHNPSSFHSNIYLHYFNSCLLFVSIFYYEFSDHQYHHKVLHLTVSTHVPSIMPPWWSSNHMSSFREDRDLHRQTHRYSKWQKTLDDVTNLCTAQNKVNKNLNA